MDVVTVPMLISTVGLAILMIVGVVAAELERREARRHAKDEQR